LGTNPAYNINPTLVDYQSLLINLSTSESDFNILLASAGDYIGFQQTKPITLSSGKQPTRNNGGQRPAGSDCLGATSTCSHHDSIMD